MNLEDGRVLASVLAIAGPILLVTASAVLLIAWGLYWDYRKKRLLHEERRAMIDKGMEPPPPPPPPAVGWPGVRQRELDLKFAERRLLIEKGLEPPPEPAKRPATRADLLRRGILMLCVAVGVGAAAVLLKFAPASPDVDIAMAWCLGLAPVIGALGAGHIIAGRFAAPAPVVAGERQPSNSSAG